jgi:hypothetical protein
VRQAVWLLVLDAIELLPRGFGSRAYLWALQRAANATDWGDGADCGEEEPF